MQRMFKATNVVLILLCAMYFISYIVRQSVSTAMLDIRLAIAADRPEIEAVALGKECSQIVADIPAQAALGLARILRARAALLLLLLDAR